MKDFKRFLPLLAILVAFGMSVYVIATRRAAEQPKDAVVIRIGHWQLEASVREAFDKLGKDFAARPEIKTKYGHVIIVQDAIPEGVYGQWVSSQMMGRTAPDLIEVGLGFNWAIWLGYQNRYFVPLTDMANRPNPYNVGTPLEGVPLRMTFTDDMRNGYTEELQEYMRVPLSRFTSRLFYNKTLLKQLTGLDQPPTDYRGFLAICEEIKKHQNARGQTYIPVACSAYHIGMWQSGLFDVLTYGDLRKADFNRDGTVGNDEFYAAIKSGAMSFNDPPIQAKFKLTADMLKNFQDGFTGLNRDDALFPFAQQRAVFISSGTWDAFSIRNQARGDDPNKSNFEVGVINYPLPSKDDPEYGKLIVGPKFDQAGQGFPFGLTNFSKHQDVAKEFLLYLSSVAGNTELNHTIGWIPSVRGIPLPEMLKDFAPADEGMYSCYNTDLGGKSILKWNQVYSKFQNDRQYGYQQMLDDFAPVYKGLGLADWQEQQRDWRRGIINNEQLLSSVRGDALLLDSTKPDPAMWIKYRVFTMNRQVTPEINHKIQERMIEGDTRRPSGIGPYDYLPEALANIRKDLTATRPNGP